MIDLDNFKPINDLLGHYVGDESLKKVANILSDTCRETDLVIRLGGDEFAVLVTTINDDNTLYSLAKRIVSNLSLPMMIMGHNVEISVSIGIAKYPEDGENQDELMRKADVALYAVKNSGRNGFKFFQSAMDVE
jgi:diguanylate cyclase (GGDEF)-like protein